MEPGKEWLRQPVSKVVTQDHEQRGPIIAGDQGSHRGHQCSQITPTGESQFQKCRCIPEKQIAAPMGGKQTVDPLY